MLFDGNRIIRIKSELLGSDLLHAEDIKGVNNLRIDIYDDQGTYKIVCTKYPVHVAVDLSKPIADESIHFCEVFTEEDFSNFFSIFDGRFRYSQLLLKLALRSGDARKATENVSEDEPMGLLYSDMHSGLCLIANGADVLTNIENDSYSANHRPISGGSKGCFISKKELVYCNKSNNVISVPVEELSLHKLCVINHEVFRESECMIALNRVEEYLGVSLPKNPKQSGEYSAHTLQLPVLKTSCGSYKNVSALYHGHKHQITINAELLKTMRSEGKKYTLYTDYRSFLLTANDIDLVGGYAANFEFIEFESLNYLFSPAIESIPPYMRKNLTQMLIDMGIETEIQYAEPVPHEFIIENKICFESVFTRDGMEHVFGVAGKEIVNEKVFDVNVAIYASPKHINCLIATDKVEQVANGCVFSVLNTLQNRLKSNAGKEESIKLYQNIVDALIGIGYLPEEIV